MKIKWKPYRVALRQKLRMAKGPELTHREGVLIRVTFGDGRVGFGDAAPLPGWSKETVEDVLAALENHRFDSPMPSLQFALDSARRAWASARPVKDIPISGLLLSWESPLPPGAASVKIKLSGSIGGIEKNLRALGSRVLPGQRLRFDGNRQFSWEEALRIADACANLPTEFLEDPTFEVGKLVQWPGRTPVPLAVDETLRELGPSHPACQAAKVFVIKPTLTGSWEACLDLASQGKAVVISSSFESLVGIHALGELAAFLPGPTLPAGLDTFSFLEHGLMDRLPIENHCFLAGRKLPKVAWDELAR